MPPRKKIKLSEDPQVQEANKAFADAIKTLDSKRGEHDRLRSDLARLEVTTKEAAAEVKAWRKKKREARLMIGQRMIEKMCSSKRVKEKWQESTSERFLFFARGWNADDDDEWLDAFEWEGGEPGKGRRVNVNYDSKTWLHYRATEPRCHLTLDMQEQLKIEEDEDSCSSIEDEENPDYHYYHNYSDSD